MPIHVDVRAPTETSQIRRTQPRHASVVLTAEYVQFGFLALVASLSVLRATPMSSPDAATWCAARPRYHPATKGAAGATGATIEAQGAAEVQCKFAQ